MARLVWEFSRSWLATLLIPLISAEWKEAIGATFWGVAGIRSVMPRTLFLMLFPWLFWLFWRWRRDSRWWPLPLVLLLTGAAANLHPVSGFLAVQIFLLMALIAQPLNGRRLGQLLLAAGAAILGVLPTLSTFISATGLTGATTVTDSFTVFARVVRFRFGTVYPFDDTLIHQFLTPAWQDLLLWALPLGLLALGALYLAGQRGWLRPVTPYRFFAAVQLLLLPLYLLLTDADAPFLLLYTLLYTSLMVTVRFWPERFSFQTGERSPQPDGLANPTGWPTRRVGDPTGPPPVGSGTPQPPTAVDWQLLWLAIIICLVSFEASGLLAWLWEHFELWGLTAIVGEQIRGARFIYLPLYLWLARQLAFWEQTWANTPARRFWLIALLSLLLWRHPWLAGLLLLGAAYAWLWHRPANLGRIVLETVLVALGLTLFVAPLDLNLAPLHLLWPTGLYLIGRHLQLEPTTRLAATVAGSLGLLLLWGLGSQVPDAWYNRPVYNLAYQLLPLPTPDTQLRQDTQALYDWARTETPVTALFYVNSLDFRYGAQRSITHAWKDLGLAYYGRVNLVPYARRIVDFEAGYRDPELMLALAEAEDVDYIVVDTLIDFSLELPIAYRNASYTVYVVP
ncbi:MAG: hypothetical protein KDE59_16350, partial [Anaerolineales bacterium]|nr:hypothetical protein [Anaerolineales bacterium]